jgi:hypothetical protein
VLDQHAFEADGRPQTATDDTNAVPPKVYPVTTPREISQAEAKLGFELPALLRDLYLQIGNGGFGPGYGLVGLPGGAHDDTGKNLIELYSGFHSLDPDDPFWRWPDRLLPVAHLGCGMYACIDCTSPEAAVVWFEPNPHSDGEPWDDSFIPLAPSMAHWLERWLAGEDLCETAFKAMIVRYLGQPFRVVFDGKESEYLLERSTSREHPYRWQRLPWKKHVAPAEDICVPEIVSAIDRGGSAG